MEWWALILVGLGVWVFGLATGFQAGASAVILKASKPTQPHPTQPNPMDMAALMQMMGQQTPGGPR